MARAPKFNPKKYALQVITEMSDEGVMWLAENSYGWTENKDGTKPRTAEEGRKNMRYQVRGDFDSSQDFLAMNGYRWE